MTIFDELCGNQLSSVEFARDYLQLRFDGPCINITNPLTVKTKKKEITSGNEGFRDLLCQQITKVISSVTFETGKELKLLFTDNSQIIVSLHPDDYSSAEAIYAHGFKDNAWFAE